MKSASLSVVAPMIWLLRSDGWLPVRIAGPTNWARTEHQGKPDPTPACWPHRSSTLPWTSLPSVSLRTLDRGENDPPASLHPDLQLRIMERTRQLDEPYDVAREKVLAEAHDIGAPLTLDDDPGWTRRGSPAPNETAPENQAPRDVDTGWGSMSERVSARQAQLRRPDSDYPRTLQEIMAEDRDAALGITGRGPLFPASDPTDRP